jgi:hypothetical protein
MYFNLPMAGYRKYSDASVNAQGASLNSYNTYGIYWSSSFGGNDSSSARTLRFDSSIVSADYTFSPAYGGSVRCFRDEYGTPTAYKVTFNPNN